MNWYRDLYVGKTYEKNPEKIMRSVEKKKTVPGLILIVLRTEAAHNQLELFTQKEFYKNSPLVEPFVILGIAFQRKEAEELLVEITEKVFQETGTALIREYFLPQI